MIVTTSLCAKIIILNSIISIRYKPFHYVPTNELCFILKRYLQNMLLQSVYLIYM